MGDLDHFSPLLLSSKKCKRKEIRKSAKKVKVACRVAFSKHQKLETAMKAQFDNKKEKKRAKRKRQKEKKHRKLLEDEDDDAEPQSLEDFLKEAESVRKERMRQEISQDEAEIEMLEKKLAGSKRRKKAPSENDEDSIESYEEYIADEDGDEQYTEDPLEQEKDESDCASSSEHVEAPEDVESCEADANEEEAEEVDTAQKGLTNFDPAIVKLAKQAKMKGRVRRAIFCTIMSSTEKDEAFKRLQALALVGPEERECIRVGVECALLESSYNAYYSLLVVKFCDFHARFQVTTQYSLWDLIKNLDSLKEHQQGILAHFIADLFKFQAVGLSVLRIINFAELTPSLSILLKRTFHHFLVGARDFVIREAFQKVINSTKKKNSFSDQLQLFFEQPVADLLVDGRQGKETKEQVDVVELFKRRIMLVKRMWSFV